MKKSKEFIFPENVDKDFGIWKDYTLKDFGYAARKNIKVRDNFKLKRHYANGQKLFYLKPKKRGELNAFEEEQNRQ